MRTLLPTLIFTLLLVWAVTEAIASEGELDGDLVSLGVIAAISAVAAMGVIEVAKRLLFVRALYHRIALDQWLRSGLSPVAVLRAERHEARSIASAELQLAVKQFLALVGIRGGDDDPFGLDKEEWAESGARSLDAKLPLVVRLYRDDASTELFDLSTEQFTAQLADAAHRAVSGSGRFTVFADAASMGSQHSVAAAAEAVASVERKLAFLRHEASNQQAGQDEDREGYDIGSGREDWRPIGRLELLILTAESELERAHEALRAAENHALTTTHKRIEAFQISAGRGWKRTISIATVALCSLLAWMLCALTIREGYATAILLGIFVCPPIAWFLRDIFAGVERWRTS